jgi:hypothetical protein
MRGARSPRPWTRAKSGVDELSIAAIEQRYLCKGPRSGGIQAAETGAQSSRDVKMVGDALAVVEWEIAGRTGAAMTADSTRLILFTWSDQRRSVFSVAD